MTVSQDISVFDDVSSEASQRATEQQFSSMDSHALFITLLWIMSPTAKLSHSEIIPSKLGFSSTVETLTDGHGTCVSFLVSTEHVETGESIGDFDTANVSEDDTIQFASVECS